MTDPTPQATFADMMRLEAHGPDTFVGVGPSYPWGGLYGGQIVAQSLRAAGLTVDEEFLPHSLHSYFIRRGDASEPIRFEVDRIRNGRSFCTRRVVARQSIGAIFNLSASFQVAEDAPDVQRIEPVDVARTPDAYESDSWSHVFDKRRVIASPSQGADGRYVVWMRMFEEIPDDPMLRACALGYLSDDLPTGAVVNDRPDVADAVAAPPGAQTFMSASLDHAVWFHRPIDPARWHLYQFRSHGLVGSRGLAIGEIIDADGVHAATVSQEVLLRRMRRQD